MKRWAEIANDYFNAGLDEESAKRWQREIRLNVKGANDPMVCEAIRMHKGTNLRRKLSVADIIGWIREDQPSQDSRLKSCRLCCRGWIELRDIEDDFEDLNTYLNAYVTTLPCMCSSGGHHLSTKYDSEQQAALQGKRQRAMLQRQRFNKLVEQIDIDELKEELAESDSPLLGGMKV